MLFWGLSLHLAALKSSPVTSTKSNWCLTSESLYKSRDFHLKSESGSCTRISSVVSVNQMSKSVNELWDLQISASITSSLFTATQSWWSSAQSLSASSPPPPPAAAAADADDADDAAAADDADDAARRQEKTRRYVQKVTLKRRAWRRAAGRAAGKCQEKLRRRPRRGGSAGMVRLQLDVEKVWGQRSSLWNHSWDLITEGALSVTDSLTAQTVCGIIHDQLIESLVENYEGRFVSLLFNQKSLLQSKYIFNLKKKCLNAKI